MKENSGTQPLDYRVRRAVIGTVASVMAALTITLANGCGSSESGGTGKKATSDAAKASPKVAASSDSNATAPTSKSGEPAEKSNEILKVAEAGQAKSDPVANADKSDSKSEAGNKETSDKESSVNKESSSKDESQEQVPRKLANVEPPVAGSKNESTAKNAEPKPKTREKLFKGWGKPLVTLVFSGRQYGYIEPCGCTGLANQKGGLARRDTFISQLAKDGWNPVPVDMGNQVRRVGKQAEIKFQVTASALKHMKYAFVGLGPDDLRLPAAELLAFVGDADGEGAYGCANVAILDRDLLPRFRVIESGGRKIGVTSVLGEQYIKQIKSDDVLTESPKEALAIVKKEMDGKKLDQRILLAFGPFDESKKLATEFGFDLVVSAGGAGEPDFQLEQIPGSKAQLAQVGIKSMYVTVVGLFDDKENPVRYQRVPLDDRWADSAEMLDRMKQYQEELKRQGLSGLGLKAIPHISGARYVGSERCGQCHTTAFQIWEKGPHAHATTSLLKPTERTTIQRHHDPECLSCHVTGWNPQKYYPYATGYLKADNKLLHGNGCENCHGPGSRHVEAEEEGELPEAKLLELRKQMVVTKKEAETKQCFTCHDLDNSPDFKWEKYWEQIKHYGKD